MTRKIRLMAAIIFILLVGILYFQGQLLYDSYKLTKRNYIASIFDAFDKALYLRSKQYRMEVQHILTNRLETAKCVASVQANPDELKILLKSRLHASTMISTQDFFEKANISIVGQDSRWLDKNLREIQINAQNVIFGNGEYKESFAERSNVKNEINFVSSKKLITIDSIKMVRLFHKELLSTPNNINIEHEIKIVPEDGIRDLAGSGKTFKPDIYFNVREYKYHDLAYYGIGKSDLYISVLFKIPVTEVLRKMITQLSMCFILLVGSILSYLYLFNTILKQKRLADMKDDFINNMTHELKTPIATVSVAIESMQSFNALQDADKTNRYLETSRKELLKLNTLVTKVLDMAGYEKNKIELMLSAVNVNELIHSIMTLDRLRLTKNVNFDFKNKSNIESIKADSVHFRNALENIVDNAIKYSNDHVEISITCYKDDLFLYFSVRDNGIGIPSADLKRVFDKFHRVTTGNIHNVKGTGLGLSYVKYVVEAHGGKISVKSEQGKGSEFIISIPAK